jgi:very-short-patch-repair endonuclease
MKKDFPRKLRKNMTDTERVLWYHLRNRQIEKYKFRRQHPIGKYIVDFICLERFLIIEVDGSQHFEQHVYDKERDQYLNNKGYRVVRFWNNEVLQEMDGVLEEIRRKLLICPSP